MLSRWSPPTFCGAVSPNLCGTAIGGRMTSEEAGCRRTWHALLWTAALLFRTSSEQAHAQATIDCGRNDRLKVTALGGREIVGNGEYFEYESRIEQSDKDVHKYIYCIINKRLYRSIKVHWYADTGR